jgi:hypothetical protein
VLAIGAVTTVATAASASRSIGRKSTKQSGKLQRYPLTSTATDFRVYQFGIPRRDPINEDGMELSPAGPTGVATGIGFQPTGGGKAAITGDFVLTADEVNPVIKALRSSGIEVTAIHSHMLTEQPRLIFMHFWGP